MDGARYLEDGRLTIYRRDGTYYARVRPSASHKYSWRSLKTSDEQAAIRAGRKLLFQLEERAEQGLPPKSKSFSAVIVVKCCASICGMIIWLLQHGAQKRPLIL